MQSLPIGLNDIGFGATDKQFTDLPSKKYDKSALIIVDMQNDFCTGSMAVEGAEEIIPKLNKLKSMKTFSLVALCRDWHPKNHISFASNHRGAMPYDSIKVQATGMH